MTRLRTLTAFFLAVLACPAFVVADERKSSVGGDWEGDLKVAGDVVLKIVLHVKQGDDGTLHASFDSPDQGSNNLPIDTIEVKEQAVHFTSKMLKVVFDGTLNEEGSTIEGTWKQGPLSLPLKLAKVDPGKTAAMMDVPAELAGAWEGTLKLGGIELRLVLHVDPDKDGRLVPTLESVDQQAKGIPITSLDLKDGTLTFAARSLGASYTGKANDAKDAFSGTFTQNGRKTPLDLKKTDKVSELNRPQTPKRPFPYKEIEVSYENPAAKNTIAGTLTIPEGDGPFPVVLMITGSGSQDRDETLFAHKPFLVIADALTRRGVAVLRVDDRGVGGSNGDVAKATSEDLAGDVLAGVEFLKTRKEIDPRRIGLMGHSEGGIIAPMVAAKSKDIAFLVLLAGTGLPGDEILRMQAGLIARAGGADDEEVCKSLEHQAEFIQMAKAMTDDQEFDAEMKAAVEKLIAGLTDEEKEGLGTSEDLKKTIEAQLQPFRSPWMRFFLRHDPRPALREVRCPVLAVNGEIDLQVPSKENLAEIEKALKAGGNSAITVHEFPGLNHLFQHAKTGAPSEYGKIEETFSPDALEFIVNWVVDQAAKSGK